MARLTAQNGVVVDVSDEKADTLRGLGYVSVEEQRAKAPAKKAASSSKPEK